MRDYYEKRAAEYDDWWLGTGLFEPRAARAGTRTSRRCVRVLRALPPARTLDLACGTGFLTRCCRGRRGVDQSASMLEIARSRRPDASFEDGDALAPRPGFERIFSATSTGISTRRSARRSSRCRVTSW